MFFTGMTKDEELKNLAKTKQEKQTSELKVFIVVRKLLAYTVAATEKSPKKFKASFVDRLRNLCLSANGNLIRANLCRTDDEKRAGERRNYQIKAFEDLKELESLSFLSLECKCILPRQYAQISRQLNEALAMLAAWMRSDAARAKTPL